MEHNLNSSTSSPDEDASDGFEFDNDESEEGFEKKKKAKKRTLNRSLFVADDTTAKSGQNTPSTSSSAVKQQPVKGAPGILNSLLEDTELPPGSRDLQGLADIAVTNTTTSDVGQPVGSTRTQGSDGSKYSAEGHGKSKVGDTLSLRTAPGTLADGPNVFTPAAASLGTVTSASLDADPTMARMNESYYRNGNSGRVLIAGLVGYVLGLRGARKRTVGRMQQQIDTAKKQAALFEPSLGRDQQLKAKATLAQKLSKKVSESQSKPAAEQPVANVMPEVRPSTAATAEHSLAESLADTTTSLHAQAKKTIVTPESEKARKAVEKLYEKSAHMQLEAPKKPVELPAVSAEQQLSDIQQRQEHFASQLTAVAPSPEVPSRSAAQPAVEPLVDPVDLRNEIKTGHSGGASRGAAAIVDVPRAHTHSGVIDASAGAPHASGSPDTTADDDTSVLARRQTDQIAQNVLQSRASVRTAKKHQFTSSSVLAIIVGLGMGGAVAGLLLLLVSG